MRAAQKRPTSPRLPCGIQARPSTKSADVSNAVGVVAPEPLQRRLELWGGIECSALRVGTLWRDQVRETGHHRRSTDLDRIAALGIRTLRYPVLWERVMPGHSGACGWRWHDTRMKRLRRLGIRVVAGLVHHGSGPRGTDLLDPLFPEKLAAYAGQAASRYPFIEDWTPVNEPLTTARFACLYGHWHPHLRDESAFLRAVANQCRAVLLAMRTIRASVPGARLVQTEDLGRVFATAPLRDQADYENGRRWLSLDLLCGLVNANHPWRAPLELAGVPARHLDELAEGETAPDLVGINHYVTSDRFLDHRTDLYPPALRGGNGKIAYADTEAARVDVGSPLVGWAPRLREAWERYRCPLAVTEAHLGCEDPQEQVRWLMHAWRAAQELLAEGADVRAVTVWALFGLVDWDSMLRERRDRYEPGAFNARHKPPRPTPLAEIVCALANEGDYASPALLKPGWWERADRVHETFRARDRRGENWARSTETG
jgi:beta-glucosidase/6-phospho-beta-glucosidase/beta-galactosidase